MAPSKLIPIKIRGKGPRKKAWQPPAKAASKSDSKKRSRSSINENGDTTDSFSSRRKRRREKLALKKAPGAPIERLPKEILEMILLWSENLNFPKASHRIGCVLSGESTFTRVVLSAFGPTWDLWFGVRPCEIVTYCTSWMEPGSTVKDPKRMGGNPEFQNGVLSCSWMSVDLMLNAQRFWLRQDAKRRRRAGERSLHYKLLELAFPGANGFDATEEDIQRCFQHEWDGHMSWAEAALRSDDDDLGLGNWSRHIYLAMETHPCTTIPNNLIKNPLRDPEKNTKLLYWLLRQGAKVEDGQSWELATLGYEQIIRHSNEEFSLVALALFFYLKVFDMMPKHVLRDKLQEATNMAKLTESQRRRRWDVAELLLEAAFSSQA